MHSAPQRLFREVGHPFGKIRSAQDSPHFGVHGGLGERDLPQPILSWPPPALTMMLTQVSLQPTESNQ